ncbi:unnamed protein product [Adineta ricciae]|uniref:Uncharacterized protein n=1 Tax=Adineta ricciae TaxID=249248 RepID=A0A815YSG6_ADIRI|nr:unnamed protein product [Adineta ricciae]
MKNVNSKQTESDGFISWIRNHLLSIALIVIGCISLAIAITLIPSLIALYLPDHSVAVIKSNQDYTDPWALQYRTSLASAHQISTRAIPSPFDKSMLGRAFDALTKLPSGTISIQLVTISFLNKRSADRVRRQDTTASANGASSDAYINVVLQAKYPRHCSHVLSCQMLFRKQALSTFSNSKNFILPFPLLNGHTVDVSVELVGLTENYAFEIAVEQQIHVLLNEYLKFNNEIFFQCCQQLMYQQLHPLWRLLSPTAASALAQPLLVPPALALAHLPLAAPAPVPALAQPLPVPPVLVPPALVQLPLVSHAYNLQCVTGWILYAHNATVNGPPCPILGSGNSASLATCQAACEAEPACNGMNYSPTAPGCYLRQCPNYSPATNIDSQYNVWLKLPPASSQWTLYAYNKTLPDSSCPNVGTGNGSSIVACQTSCDAQSTCNGVNFSPSYCYFRQCNSYSPTANVYSGFSVWLKI